MVILNGFGTGLSDVGMRYCFCSIFEKFPITKGVCVGVWVGVVFNNKILEVMQGYGIKGTKCRWQKKVISHKV